MKKLSMICLVAVLASCSPAAQKQEKTSGTVNPDKTIVYTCSMHPEVAETQPGTCPKCGMDLVEKQH
jgi:hypothetical protein